MIPNIPSYLVKAYEPVSKWDALYLRIRWRLCPYKLVESFLPKRGKILDFGCGYGLLTNLLTINNAYRSALGVDLSSKRIRVAELSAINRNNIAFYSEDINEISETDFDAIVMTDVLHHICDSNVSRLFNILISRLNSNGTIVILDVNKTPFWKYCFTYLIDRVLNPGSRLYYRSIREMRCLLTGFPLIIEKIIRADNELPLSDIIYICKIKSSMISKDR